uniref:protein-tyrosine-phosphatase n=1 Tax=Oncorhynchus mykiss TaxID=8022 RepID=A0A8C7NUQ8_ONCMY
MISCEINVTTWGGTWDWNSKPLGCKLPEVPAAPPANVRLEDGVYIGAASDLKDAQDLTNAGITYILTVDSEQPTSPDGSFRMKRVHALDKSSTDLLSHLDDCILFRCDACKASKAVLVHCHVGQSQSAAVVTAYLVKCHKMNFGAAYAKLQQLKPDQKQQQLQWERLHHLEKWTWEEELDGKGPWAQPGEYRRPKEELEAAKAERRRYEEAARRSGWKPGSQPQKFLGGGLTGSMATPGRRPEPTSFSLVFFQLLCPKCTSKLGSLYWCGEQCSCSRWVTPFFLIHKNRVDEIKHISIATRSGARIK